MIRALLAPTIRLLRFRGRIFRRLVAEHAFVLFALGPVVLGTLFWILHRYLWALREPAARGLEHGGAIPTDPLALALALVFAIALWPGSLHELFGRTRGGQDLVDTLPVPEGARLLASMVAALGRSLIPSAVFLGAVATLATVESRPWGLWMPPVVLALAHLALLDLLLAALVVRLGWASLGRVVALGGVVGLLIVQPWTAARHLLWPLGIAGAELRRVLEACLGVGTAAPSAIPAAPSAIPPILLAALAGSGLVLAALVLPYRRRDIEKGQAFDRSAPRRSGGEGASGGLQPASLLPGGLPASLGGAVVAAQLRRDLRLVMRRFSPAVQVALGLVVVALGSAVLLGLDASQEALWRRQAMVCALASAVLGSVSIVPFLLKHQLPVFWIEKSVGVSQEGIWRTKIATSVLLAVPSTSIGLVLLMAVAPGTAVEKMLACLQLLAMAGVLSTIVGLAAFEMPSEPVISLVFSGVLGAAASALFVVYGSFWWLWLVFYGWIAGQLADRAARRVDLLEVES